MVFTEIYVIIEPCTRLACSTQQMAYNGTYGRVDGEERTKKHHIVLIYLGQFTVQLNRRVIFIEDVLRIIVFVQECQCYVRLDILVSADIFRRHAILKQIVAYKVSHMVVTDICYHGTWHTGPSKRNNAVECRATWNSFLGLVVLEQDIQHGFTYAYYTFFGYIIL